MNYQIEDRFEEERGCGYRKPGGKYMVGEGVGISCGKFPILLPDICPCCSAGIKQSRSFQWIGNQLIDSATCSAEPCRLTEGQPCPPFGTRPRYGLMWVGRQYYPTAYEFKQEAARMGISKRIGGIPQGFEVNKDWVFLGHPEVVFSNGLETPLIKPGLFMAFRPKAFEYVVTGEETGAELLTLVEKGYTLVRVHKKAKEPEESGENA